MWGGRGSTPHYIRHHTKPRITHEHQTTTDNHSAHLNPLGNHISRRSTPTSHNKAQNSHTRPGTKPQGHTKQPHQSPSGYTGQANTRQNALNKTTQKCTQSVKKKKIQSFEVMKLNTVQHLVSRPQHYTPPSLCCYQHQTARGGGNGEGKAYTILHNHTIQNQILHMSTGQTTSDNHTI